MADGMSADMSAVLALAGELAGVEARIVPAMQAVTSKGALNIKNQAVALIRGQSQGKYVKQYPNSIDYDLSSAGLTVSADVGPNRGKPQGQFGYLFEFGGPRSAPMPHMIPAWEAEAPNYEIFMADAAATAVWV